MTTDTQKRLLAITAAALVVILVIILQHAFDIIDTAYWVCHLLAFACWTPLMFGLSLQRWLAAGSSLLWILGHELITDPLGRLNAEPAAGYWVQFDHIAAGMVGTVIGLAIIAQITRASGSHKSLRDSNCSD